MSLEQFRPIWVILVETDLAHYDGLKAVELKQGNAKLAGSDARYIVMSGTTDMGDRKLVLVQSRDLAGDQI